MTTTSPAGLATGRWILDVARSTATFRVASLGRTVTGTVPFIEGTVDTGPDGLPSAITGALDLGAIDTGNARRDADLRKPRFLDLDAHPTMAFAADTVTAAPAGWTIAGRLSARGTSVRLTGDVEVSRQGGRRSVPLDRFLTGPKCTALRPGDLITAVVVPVLQGRQEYLKVGVRNAMVIAIASLALVVDQDGRTVRVGLGSVGPTALRAPAAESFIAERLDWEAAGPTLRDLEDAGRFAGLVASSARPIDDHRATAAYRRHAVGVCARRALQRVLERAAAAEGDEASWRV